MRHHKKWACALLLVAVLGAGVGYWLLPPYSAINAANAARIERGLTLAEVVDILGERPQPVPGSGGRTFVWRSGHHHVDVTLDDAGRVMTFNSLPMGRQSFVDRVRGWLNL